MSAPKSWAQRCLDEWTGLDISTDPNSPFDVFRYIGELEDAIAKDTHEREAWKGPYGIVFNQKNEPNGNYRMRLWEHRATRPDPGLRPCYIVPTEPKKEEP